MNKKLIPFFGFFLLAIGFTACVDPDSTAESILEKDKKSHRGIFGREPDHWAQRLCG